jgi:hypothetical protein
MHSVAVPSLSREHAGQLHNDPPVDAYPWSSNVSRPDVGGNLLVVPNERGFHLLDVLSGTPPSRSVGALGTMADPWSTFHLSGTRHQHDGEYCGSRNALAI